MQTEIVNISFDQSDCPLTPGRVVDQTGIYEICHPNEGRQTVLLLYGAVFPPCPRCGDSVRYRLVRAAPYIFDDPDFA